MMLTFLLASVALRVVSQLFLLHQLQVEKKLWEFMESHVEFTDGGHRVVHSRDNTIAVHNTGDCINQK